MRILLLVLAACGGSTSATAPLSHQADPVVAAPRAGAPTIAWGDQRFDVKGLPAVARAGQLAVFAVVDSDGARGYPNLRLEAHDRGDKLVERIDVLASSDFDKLVVDGKPTPALQQTIDAANAELAKLHDLHDLQPTHALEVVKPADGGEQHLAMGDDLDVDFGVDHLHVFVHNTDKPLATVPTASWLAKPGPRCAQCPPCENPAYLDHVFHATAIPLLVVEIAYKGTDTCWEPSNQLHVVSW